MNASQFPGQTLEPIPANARAGEDQFSLLQKINQLLYNISIAGSGGGAPSGAAGGYLGGTYPDPDVLKTKGTTTNDNATAGDVGQIMTGTASAALTTNTTANVGNIALTAGDWDVEGWVTFSGADGATVVQVAAISIVSATLPGDSTEIYSGTPLSTTNADTVVLTRRRISIAVPTTVFAVANCDFGASSAANANGFLTARRVR